MGKQRKNGEEKGKKQEGSFTLSLLSPGYATAES